jgi:aspartyl aminopeptidase
MNYKKYNKELFKFIKNANSSFTGVKTIKNILLKNKFIELEENNIWNLEKNQKYFVIRNDSSIIAFKTGGNDNFNITCTHIDTPSLTIKPKNEIEEKNYLKINVSLYGGLLNYAWLDEVMSASGRVIIKNKNKYLKVIIDLQEPLFCIPSVAIHQNEFANVSLNLDNQIDMLPIVSLNNSKDVIKTLIKKKLNIKKNEEICDYDLFLYSTSNPTYFGLNKEFILSPRIDDLTCVYSALKSFIETNNKNCTTIFTAFNSEEIGSLTNNGADSSFFMDTLKKISASLGFNITKVISNSTILSADNTHATHPNHPSNSDINNEALLNKGIVISKDTPSTTDGITSSIFKGILEKAHIPYQDFVTKNNMSSGSTLSGISLRHVSIDSIDIGIAELAMHGAKEIIGSMDAYYLYLAFKEFYKTHIIKEKNKIILK